ncbi:tetratricopeptide repeat protein [Nocardioides sp. Iso805N]|uniref:tetratricopeptide repeat protein n=1 Tax=Nocardioides sp. Iso805N TaxID=1283287 RepID=UPI0003A8319A|nr:tetratricopeptide repeat protein [Nocardioides sp. Iso805N]
MRRDAGKCADAEEHVTRSVAVSYIAWVLRDVTCRQVFLASPGGLESERRACRDVYREHNESAALRHLSFFYVHAWEDVPGGVGRAQGRINPRMDGCDYAVVMFHDRWGSPTSEDSKYSSGTEEEFYRAIELLADAKSEMRDMLVLFKDIEAARMRDPGDDLKKVLTFRSMLEQPNSRGLMFETFDSEASLRHKIGRKMREWLHDDGPKAPVVVDLSPGTIDTGALRNLDPAALLAAARSYTDQRLFTQAEAAYAAATVDDDPAAVLEFGQFMRRTGRADRAMDLNRQVVADGGLLASQTGEAAALRVRAMSNIGVLQRHLGELGQSVRTLSEAVRTAEAARAPIPDELCYARDNYGHSLLRAGKIDAARTQFELAHVVREEIGTPDQLAQSAINLGRFHLEQSNYEDAIPYFATARGLLEDDSDEHLRANALAGQAEAHIRLGQHFEAEPLLESAYEINEQLSNQKGLGIVCGLQARCLLQSGQLDKATERIAATQEIADSTSDVQGAAVSALLRAEHAWRAGEPSAATFLAAADVAVAEASDAGLRSDLENLKNKVQGA